MTDTDLTVFGVPASGLPEVLGNWGVDANVTNRFCTKLLDDSLLISTCAVVPGPGNTDFDLRNQYYLPWLRDQYHARNPNVDERLVQIAFHGEPIQTRPNQRRIPDYMGTLDY